MSETVTAVVCPSSSSSSSKLFSGLFLMNKNGQHSYKFLIIFHFGITTVEKNYGERTSY